MEKNIGRVIVLGGGNDQIELIKTLRSKFEKVIVILIDYFINPPAKSYSDKHYQCSTLDPKKVLEIAQKEKIDLIITSCTDQALLTMAFVSEELNLPCYLTYKQALSLTNKSIMKMKMIENDIPTSKYVIVNQLETVNINDFKFPVVIKPVDNNGSKGISKVASYENLDTAIEKALSYSRSGKAIVEEYVQGDEYSIDAILINGKAKIIISTIYNKMNLVNGKFTIVQSIYPVKLSDALNKKIMLILEKVGVAFGLVNSPIFMQILIQNEDISVIEFSARTGGGSKQHFIRKLVGIDINDNLLDLTFNKIPVVSMHECNKFASMNYIYTKPGIFEKLVGMEEMKDANVVEEYYLYKELGTSIEKSDSSSDRPAGFLVIANSFEELFLKIEQVDQNVKVLCNNQDIMLHGIYNGKGV